MRYLIVLLLTWGLSSCCWLQNCNDPAPPGGDPFPTFTETPRMALLSTDLLTEVSGIAPSFRFPGHLWAIEDSGNDPKLELIREDGSHIKSLTFQGTNRDWEDLAVGPGPLDGTRYVYIAEIGDNNARYGDYYIYRFPEPHLEQGHISTYETLHFRYPNGESFDAETLLVDPLTRDIFVITKNQLNVRVYRLAYPQNTAGVNVAEFMGSISYLILVGGDISASGEEILLKTYNAVYYWRRRAGESIPQTLSRTHDLSPPYRLEPQGESICWDTESTGYFTLSEKGNTAIAPPLYYYSKLLNR